MESKKFKLPRGAMNKQYVPAFLESEIEDECDVCEYCGGLDPDPIEGCCFEVHFIKAYKIKGDWYNEDDVIILQAPDRQLAEVYKEVL